ncbi:MAG: plasmid mobilization relaxosome protein MobC [Oscillospiraceae bacterium]|nr:plasmid mobilization relaxosome protein MobC [Oscillospiraceae bacterium]
MKKENHHFHLELTPEQYQMLCGKARACGLTKRRFLTRFIEGKEIRARPSEEMRKLRLEIHYIGVNINQIARSVNAGIARPEDAKHGLYMLEQVYEMMDRLEKR